MTLFYRYTMQKIVRSIFYVSVFVVFYVIRRGAGRERILKDDDTYNIISRQTDFQFLFYFNKSFMGDKMVMHFYFYDSDFRFHFYFYVQLSVLLFSIIRFLFSIYVKF